MEQQEFRSLAKNRNLYEVKKPLDGDLSYAKAGDLYFSETLYERGYNILSLVQSGHLELVPRVFPFEKEVVGKNRHAVFTICPECGSHGVNMPLEKECGNCGYTETRTYYDAHTIHELLISAIEARDKELRERLTAAEDFISLSGSVPVTYEQLEAYTRWREAKNKSNEPI